MGKRGELDSRVLRSGTACEVFPEGVHFGEGMLVSGAVVTPYLLPDLGLEVQEGKRPIFQRIAGLITEMRRLFS